jgi:chromosome segregation ATPase
MRTRFMLLLVIPVLSIFLLACGDDDNSDPGTGDAGDFEAQAERRLEQLDERIQEAEDRVRETDAPAEAESEVEALKDERSSVEQKLDEFRGASGDRAEQLQEEIETSLEGLESKADSLASDLEEALRGD